MTSGKRWDRRTSARSGRARGARPRPASGRARCRAAQIVEVVAVDALDPAAGRSRTRARIAHTDGHGSQAHRYQKQHGPDSSLARSVRAVLSAVGSLRDLLLRAALTAVGRRRRRGASAGAAAGSRSIGRQAAGAASAGASGGRQPRQPEPERPSAAAGGVAARLGAGGFLLRAGRQHQRRNECAKSKFGVHRSVPRREARVV